jgi:hypothetical protein
MAKFALYCTCGASWHGEAPEELVAIIKDQWEKHHTGPGHESTTSGKAANARTRNEYKLLKIDEEA